MTQERAANTDEDLKPKPPEYWAEKTQALAEFDTGRMGLEVMGSIVVDETVKIEKIEEIEGEPFYDSL